MTGDQLRELYLRFFEEKGHKIIPSAPLIPKGDPTLLFTSAGMVQFKPYFLGEAVPPSPRMASCQKCFRTTDIESVGDASHLTFFEMLGNFSVGDYFKKEAIAWAWEFCTQRLKLPLERLWATIFLDDDESFGYWREIGVPEKRIVRMDEKSNFWGPPGDSGPCGPCSEIIYDFGEDVGCGRPTCDPSCSCGRFCEIWNLVFTQYNQDKQGKRTPLPKPNIDTGMGLERTAAILQGKNSVYGTDLFQPLLKRLADLSGKSYGAEADVDHAMRVVVEHGRGVTFLLADGVMPGNDGAGYVLRRLLRRATVFSRRLGMDKPFLTEVAKATIKKMGHVYPEIAQRQDFILKVIESEVQNSSLSLLVGSGIFQNTLIEMRKELANHFFNNFEPIFNQILIEQDYLNLRDRINNAVDHFLRDCHAFEHVLIVGGRDAIKEALRPVEDKLNELKETVLDYETVDISLRPNAFVDLKQHLRDIFEVLKQNVDSLTKNISGLEVFILHDTYGLQKELTNELAISLGYSVDLKGFEQEMEKQRQKARAAHKFVGALEGVVELDAELGIKETRFVGYDTLESKSKILALLVEGKPVQNVEKGTKSSLILDVTPFYGEMGGQVGDTGEIISKSGRFVVTNTVRSGDVTVHRGEVVEGALKAGDQVEAKVDKERRLDIARNHTATHLLHLALRQVLGKHAEQRGSLVVPERLRFDFSHLNALMPEEIEKVNHIVNEKIRQNLPVICEEMSYQEAIKAGAIAIFEEKYGEVVRALKIGEPPVSVELCGGTHIKATGEIGFFRVVSETSIGSGLRRIEAVTGRGAEAFVDQQSLTVSQMARELGATPDNVPKKLADVLAELDAERKRSQTLESELARRLSESLLQQVELVDGVRLLSARVPSTRIEALREMGDFLREKMGSGIVVLGTVSDDRPIFLAVVTQDLVARGYNAGDIVKQVAKVAGGGGGGKPTLAQAGGKDKSKVDEALKLVKSLIKSGGA